MGRDRGMQRGDQYPQFQFTRPAWGATSDRLHLRQRNRVSIHAPRMGRDKQRDAANRVSKVSIHAPRMGRDDVVVEYETTGYCFNSRAPHGARLFTRAAGSRLRVSIHAPRMGRDWDRAQARRKLEKFQFTRPAWGATQQAQTLLNAVEFQFTRPAWGAT